jgi:hypothetical protein
MDPAKVLIPCSRFTPATILPALLTTSLQALPLSKVDQWHSRIGWPIIRRSAKTRSWENAEDFKRKLEEEYEAKERRLEEASRPEPALVTVKEAVAHFLNNKRNENLADSTREIKGSRQPVYRTQIGPKLADPECTIGLWVMSETMSFPPPAIERRLYLLKLI